MKNRSKHASDRIYSYSHAGRWETKTVGEAREEEYRARRAEIPEDTRDLTAMFCGDPIPGRRAIDKRAPS